MAPILFGLAATSFPDPVLATEIDVIRWFSDAAAPALQTAAPTNDPVLAGRELLNRGLASASTHLQRAGPAWLTRVRFDLRFDPAFQPRYAVAATQPLLAITRHDASVDLHGRVVYDATGHTGGDLGVRYQGSWRDHEVAFGVQGGIEDRWLEELQRYRFGTEVRLSSLEVRANLYDDVPARPVTREIAERRLDGYDLELGAQVPSVPWARVRASRFWHIAVNGDALTTRDRIGLRLTPLAPLEIETGMQREAETRSWFTQLRWRMQLGG